MAIYLDPKHKFVHACKYNPQLGAAMTRCGFTFLMGNQMFRKDAEFGAPAREGSDGKWKQCPKCQTMDFKDCHTRWKAWKQMLKRTLRAIGVEVQMTDCTVEPLDYQQPQATEA